MRKTWPSCSRRNADMREMILNHASLFAPDSDRGSISKWLRDAVRGMNGLIQHKVVSKSLRMSQNFIDTPCLSDYSLQDACNELRTRGYRDEYVSLLGLATKIPLLSDVEESVKDRFHACEEIILPSNDGAPLVLCAVTDGIAVGFPSDPIWDRDRATVTFDELLLDETISKVSEEIDQLTRSAHAEPICERHRDRLRAGANPRKLWANRQAIFPHLVFGPDVEGNLMSSAHLIETIVGKLVAIDRSARDWRNMGGPAPPWGTKVSPESSNLKPALRERRRFRSHRGTSELFEWHARFGSSGRIHLRFEEAAKEIEIGYIGPHLPL